MYCIRNKRSGRIMGVSYSVDGLYFCTDKVGRCILYKNGVIYFDPDRQRLTIRPVKGRRLIYDSNYVIVPYEYRSMDINSPHRYMEDVFAKKARQLLYE